MLSRIRFALQNLFRRSVWERQMDDELEFHIERRSEELQRSGLSEREARRRACIEFGGIEAYKERCREARGAGWIDELARNLSYAGRSMTKRYGFTLVAVLSLTLGIGANVALFSLVKNLMLSPLPVRDPGNLYGLVLSTARTDYRVLSYPMFQRLQEHFSLFSTVVASTTSPRRVTIRDAVVNAQVTSVSGGYFEGLGVRPALGRLITPGDDHPGSDADVVVLSYRTWKNQFGGDPRVLGATLRIEKDVFRIIGVTTSEFLGTSRSAVSDVYAPLSAAAQHYAPWLRSPGLALHIMVRLGPGVSLAAARAALRERWPRFAAPRRNGNHARPDYLLLEDASNGLSFIEVEFSRALLALMGLAGVVLLIACSNLATLLFVRGAGRAGETSIRVALGATRAQLVRQWMTECLLLAAIGGVSGLVVAKWINRVLLNFVPESDRGYLAFHADVKVLVFTLAVTLAAGILFGLLPSLGSSKVGTDSALRQHSQTVAGRTRLSEWILATQLAACLVLVVAATLLARTLWNLNSAPTGFDNSVVYANAQFTSAGYSRQRAAAAMNEAADRISSSPNIASVGMGLPPFLVGLTVSGWAVVPGYAYGPEEDNTVYYCSVTPGYFKTLAIPLVAGRMFEDQDRIPSPSRVVIVSESFARHYFGDRDPIGQSVTITNRTAPGAPAPSTEIVGVVADSRRDTVRENRKDFAYFPIVPNDWDPIVARPKPGVPAGVCEAEIRSVFTALAKNVPLEISSLEKVKQKSLGRDRLVSQISAAFGLLGIVLAAIGLYASMAHLVSSRTREIGIRLALGADPWAIRWMVLRRTLLTTGVAVLIGLPTAALGLRVIRSLLFGISPADPWSLSVSAALLVIASLAAAWWPARRATRLDPTLAIRCE